MTRPISNPYARGFRVEEHIDRRRTKDARRARDVELGHRAREMVQTALDGCEDGLRDDLSLALIEAATLAAGRLHDPERIQAHLGKLAHENGAVISTPSAQRKASAEAAFRKAATA